MSDQRQWLDGRPGFGKPTYGKLDRDSQKIYSKLAAKPKTASSGPAGPPAPAECQPKFFDYIMCLEDHSYSMTSCSTYYNSFLRCMRQQRFQKKHPFERIKGDVKHRLLHKLFKGRWKS